MARNFGLVQRARDERKRAINPEAPLDQIHGDFPWLDTQPLRQIDRDMQLAWARGIRKFAYALLIIAGLIAAAIIIVAIIVIIETGVVGARDLDGRYANSPLKSWFDQLASGKGLCCSFADGVSIQDVDWDTQDGRYRVRLHGEWVIVPDSALVTEPNRFGPAVVWPYQDSDGATQIRCFMPGAGA